MLEEKVNYFPGISFPLFDFLFKVFPVFLVL